MVWHHRAATEEVALDATRKVEATNDFMSTQHQLVLAKPQQSAAAASAAATSAGSEVILQTVAGYSGGDVDGVDGDLWCCSCYYHVRRRSLRLS